MSKRWFILQAWLIVCHSMALIGSLVIMYAARTSMQAALASVIIFDSGISLYLETCRYIAAKKGDR